MFLLSGHALVKRSLAELLEHEGFEVVGEAESIAGALTGVYRVLQRVASGGGRSRLESCTERLASLRHGAMV
ncbi:hypothetical protein CTI14_48680, partial [Methylobacterium radiotolerans]